jgi:hypothetical protein
VVAFKHAASLPLYVLLYALLCVLLYVLLYVIVSLMTWEELEEEAKK